MFSEILLVDRSKERIRKLSRRLSKKVTGTSRSREDIDTFFLSLDLREARNLKPALDYVSQENFDIFILNSWNTNDIYQPLEKDLTGSIHSDMPIMMPIQMPKFIDDKNRTREFAIGYDAFEIILLRYGSINSRDFIYKGLTGKIKLDRGENKRSSYVFEITNEGIKIL
jgi:outer membrane PBP1 activator LpoA protein